MNDPIRTQYYARLGIVPTGSPAVGGTESAQSRSSSVAATQDSGSPRSTMASLRSTMPPPPQDSPKESLQVLSQVALQVESSQAHSAEEQVQASGSESTAATQGPVAGVDTQAIQEGLRSAEKVGVKAAKLTFWGKLAGAVVTGLGLVAFGVLTGGVGPLAVAGLALTGAFFLKSCADVHMARLQLQNANAKLAGQPPPHDLPCGADAMAHMLYRPFSKWATKGIDPNNKVALEQAQEKAKKWAKGVSMGLDLALGISAVAVIGVANGKVAESLACLGMRVLANSFTSMVVRTPPEIYQQESIDLAQKDLADMEELLQSIDIGSPPTSNDPNALAHYLEKYQTLSALQESFAGVKKRFEAQLHSYQSGIQGIDPSSRADFIDGVSAAVGAGSDGADLGLGLVEHVTSDLGLFTAGGMATFQTFRTLQSLKKQEGIEESLTRALLDMNADLKLLNKDALEFNHMLGLTPPEFPTAPPTAPPPEPQLLEPIKVQVT